jgi:hypothetical protein
MRDNCSSSKEIINDKFLYILHNQIYINVVSGSMDIHVCSYKKLYIFTTIAYQNYESLKNIYFIGSKSLNRFQIGPNYFLN